MPVDVLGVGGVPADLSLMRDDGLTGKPLPDVRAGSPLSAVLPPELPPKFGLFALPVPPAEGTPSAAASVLLACPSAAPVAPFATAVLSAVDRLAAPNSTCAALEAKFKDDTVSEHDCASGDKLHTSSTLLVPHRLSCKT